MIPLLAANFDILESLRQAFIDMGHQIIAFVPKLVVAAIITFTGWVLAKAFSGMLSATFEKAGLNRMIAQSDAGAALAKTGVKAKPGAIIGRILFWVTFLFVLKTAAQTAGMADIAAVIQGIFAFLPRLLVATIILLAGFLVADLLRGAVQRALSAFGVDYAHSLATLLFGFVFVLVLTVALHQIGIQTELLNATVKILVAGVAVAFALALGLGLRECAAALVAGIYARDLLTPGTEIEIDGEKLIVVGVGPVTAKLQRSDGSLFIFPNARLTGETLRARPAPRE
jgi:hypothetical protein